jgi:hypothetical protein
MHFFVMISWSFRSGVGCRNIVGMGVIVFVAVSIKGGELWKYA